MFTIGVNMLTTKLIYSLPHKIFCSQHTLFIPCITKKTLLTTYLMYFLCHRKELFKLEGLTKVEDICFLDL
jgi:hypothetical protein